MCCSINELLEIAPYKGGFCYTFDMKKISYTTSFADRVRAVVRTIPKGHTMSYADVAAKAGSPGACRAVGTVMKHNYDNTVPCHRVICSNGTVGHYNRGGVDAKRALLHAEGVHL